MLPRLARKLLAPVSIRTGPISSLRVRFPAVLLSAVFTLIQGLEKAALELLPGHKLGCLAEMYPRIPYTVAGFSVTMQPA